MKDIFRTLIIHIKTDSLTICLFHHDVCIFKEIIYVNTTLEQLNHVDRIVNTHTKLILQKLERAGINMSRINAVGANGGLIRPVDGGTYIVNKPILEDLSNHFNGMHVSNIAPIIAHKIAEGLNIAAYIVDPPVVNEMTLTATYTGLPDIERKSIFHALNQKYVARKLAKKLNQTYDESKFIIAHISSGISIGAHELGDVTDVNNGFHGEGPFSLERTGTIPSEGLVQLCYSNLFKKEELLMKITHDGGIKAYMQTNNIDQIFDKLKMNDQKAKAIFKAMGYQISKEIGSMASVLKGDVDAVILTGELSNLPFLTNYIINHVDWIADVFIYEGEYEIQALNDGVLRVLNQEEQPKIYHFNIKEDNVI